MKNNEWEESVPGTGTVGAKHVGRLREGGRRDARAAGRVTDAMLRHLNLA